MDDLILGVLGAVCLVGAATGSVMAVWSVVEMIRCGCQL